MYHFFKNVYIMFFKSHYLPKGICFSRKIYCSVPTFKLCYLINILMHISSRLTHIEYIYSIEKKKKD